MKTQHKQQSILGLPRVCIASAMPFIDGEGEAAMATTKGLGRLVFGGRQEYRAMPYYRAVGGVYVGCAAICTCPLGNHYLSPSGECTVSDTEPVYVYPTYDAAVAAIETWQIEQQQKQRASGESEAE